MHSKRLSNKLHNFRMGFAKAPVGFSPDDYDYLDERKRALKIETTCWVVDPATDYGRRRLKESREQQRAFLDRCGSAAEVYRRSHDAQYLLHMLAYSGLITQQLGAEIVYKWETAEINQTRSQGTLSKCLEELRGFLGSTTMRNHPEYSKVTRDQWPALAVSAYSVARTIELLRPYAETAERRDRKDWVNRLLVEQVEQSNIVRQVVTVDTVKQADLGVFPPLSSEAHKELLALQRQHDLAECGRASLTLYQAYRFEELFARYSFWAASHYAALPKEHLKLQKWRPISPEEKEEVLELEYKRAVAEESGTALPLELLSRLHHLIGRCIIMKTGSAHDPEHN